jgi:predicted RNase H-like HicB family nuclease
VSCEEATVFQDDEGWKMMLEGFMEPWQLGRTVEEAKASIKEYAKMGFGLS